MKVKSINLQLPNQRSYNFHCEVYLMCIWRLDIFVIIVHTRSSKRPSLQLCTQDARLVHIKQYRVNIGTRIRTAGGLTQIRNLWVFLHIAYCMWWYKKHNKAFELNKICYRQNERTKLCLVFLMSLFRTTGSKSSMPLEVPL